jgi:hypothetical protein
MPFKKRARQYRRRRSTKPKRYRTSGARARLHAPKHFTETIMYRDVVSLQTSGGPNPYNNSVTLNAINNYNSLEDVFKQACITGVKLMYIPNYNTYTAPGGTIPIPKIYFAEDKDAVGGPTPTLQTMLQMDNLKIFRGDRAWKHYIKMPRPYYRVQEPTSTDFIQVQPNSRAWEWVSTEDPDAGSVEWLNSIMLVDSNISTSDVVIGKLYAKVYYAMKEQK